MMLDNSASDLTILQYIMFQGQSPKQYRVTCDFINATVLCDFAWCTIYVFLFLSRVIALSSVKYSSRVYRHLNRNLGGARLGWDETGHKPACRENNN